MSSVSATKTCTKCKLVKSVEDFYVKVKKTGRRFSWCKTCHNIKTTANYLADHEANKQKRRKYAREKYKADPEAGRQKMKEWREENPEKVKEIEKRGSIKRADKKHAYREANKEKRRAYNAAWRAANREKLRAAGAAYREQYKLLLRGVSNRWRQTNPLRDYEIHSRWKRNNREAVRAAGHRRRARIAGVGGSYTAAEWEAVKKRYGYRCLWCGRKEPEVKLCVDHVIAVSRGGANVIANIQPLCRPCNSRKHARNFDYRWRAW